MGLVLDQQHQATAPGAQPPQQQPHQGLTSPEVTSPVSSHSGFNLPPTGDPVTSLHSRGDVVTSLHSLQQQHQQQAVAMNMSVPPSSVPGGTPINLIKPPQVGSLYLWLCILCFSYSLSQSFNKLSINQPKAVWFVSKINISRLQMCLIPLIVWYKCIVILLP